MLISSSRVIRIGLWSDPSVSITRQAHLSIRLELTSDTSGVDIESTDLLYLVGVPSLRQDMSLIASQFSTASPLVSWLACLSHRELWAFLSPIMMSFDFHGHLSGVANLLISGFEDRGGGGT